MRPVAFTCCYNAPGVAAEVSWEEHGVKCAGQNLLPAHGLSLLTEVTAGHVKAVLADDTVLVPGAPVHQSNVSHRSVGDRRAHPPPISVPSSCGDSNRHAPSLPSMQSNYTNDPGKTACSRKPAQASNLRGCAVARHAACAARIQTVRHQAKARHEHTPRNTVSRVPACKRPPAPTGRSQDK